MIDRREHVDPVERREAIADELANHLLITYLGSPKIEKADKVRISNSVREGSGSVALIENVLFSSEEHYKKVFYGLDLKHLEKTRDLLTAYRSDPLDDRGDSVFEVMWANLYIHGKIDALTEPMQSDPDIFDEKLQELFGDESAENRTILHALVSASLDKPVSTGEIAQQLNDEFPDRRSEVGSRYSKLDVTNRFDRLRRKLNEADYSLVSVNTDEEWGRGYFLLGKSKKDRVHTRGADLLYDRSGEDLNAQRVEVPNLSEKAQKVLQMLEQASLEEPIASTTIAMRLREEYPEDSIGSGDATDLLRDIRLATGENVGESDFVIASRRVGSRRGWHNGYFLISRDQKRVSFDSEGVIYESTEEVTSNGR